jgi:hypothetical protein
MLFLGLSASLAACGDAAPGTIVARVGGNSITSAGLERWTKIEAVLAYEASPTRPVPQGVVPDPPAYVNCIAYLRSTAGLQRGQPAPTGAQLRRRCDEKHALLQHHVLDILIDYFWLKGESSEKGVRLTNGEIKEVLDRIFPNTATFGKYLSITGESPSDERLIIEKDLFSTKLLQLKEKAFKRGRLTSTHQREQALITAAREFTTKWASRTWCRAGYVVSECRQYKGTRSLMVP